MLAAIGAGVAEGKPGRPRPRTKVITLERSQCFGACPVYKLTIFSDGKVGYEGIRYVKKVGVASSSISRAKLNELVKAFLKIDYFTLPESFTAGSKQCPQYATDMPSATTSLTWQGQTKTVQHYHGCMGSDVLKELTELEAKIDTAVKVTRWTK
jgi:hypothetical protein